MALAKKGKRTTIYNGKTYYWAVIPDYDSPAYILTICTADKKIILHYELDQINAPIINPEIRIVACPEGGPRVIPLFPPEGDEIASPRLVIKILACYDKNRLA